MNGVTPWVASLVVGVTTLLPLSMARAEDAASVLPLAPELIPMNGPYQESYANGTIKREATYRNGKLSGFVRTYHPNGTLQSECFFVEGMRHGPCQKFNADGTLWLAMTYRHGMPDGIERLYNDAGDLMAETTFKEGLKHGPHKFWGPDGMLAWEHHYANDKQDGEQRLYSPIDGSLISIERCIHGQCTEQPLPR